MTVWNLPTSYAVLEWYCSTETVISVEREEQTDRRGDY
jgi:hypothetical protein